MPIDYEVNTYTGLYITRGNCYVVAYLMRAKDEYAPLNERISIHKTSFNTENDAKNYISSQQIVNPSYRYHIIPVVDLYHHLPIYPSGSVPVWEP